MAEYLLWSANIEASVVSRVVVSLCKNWNSHPTCWCTGKVIRLLDSSALNWLCLWEGRLSPVTSSYFRANLIVLYLDMTNQWILLSMLMKHCNFRKWVYQLVWDTNSVLVLCAVSSTELACEGYTLQSPEISLWCFWAWICKCGCMKWSQDDPYRGNALCLSFVWKGLWVPMSVFIYSTSHYMDMCAHRFAPCDTFLHKFAIGDACFYTYRGRSFCLSVQGSRSISLTNYVFSHKRHRFLNVWCVRTTIELEEYEWYFNCKLLICHFVTSQNHVQYYFTYFFSYSWLYKPLWRLLADKDCCFLCYDTILWPVVTNTSKGAPENVLMSCLPWGWRQQVPSKCWNHLASM